MSGYNGYSMSNNAVNAYNSGKVPFSKLPRDLKKIGRDELKRIGASIEWHHTSKFYNCTDFYEIDEIYALCCVKETPKHTFNYYASIEGGEAYLKVNPKAKLAFAAEV